MKNTSELKELLAAGVISPETAERIEAYWQERQLQQPNRLTIVFSLLGALLVGLGTILVVAHNWDQLSRIGKTIIAFVPVIIGQVAAWYTLRRKPESRAWREGSGVFLLLALGACLAMVSQIYHLEGRMSEFLLGWIWLALPIMYVLDSALASLLFWAGISWYAAEASYFEYPDTFPVWYWFFVVAALPYYIMLRKKRPGSNYQNFHDWVIPLSLTLCLGTLERDAEALLLLDYQLLLILFYVLGKWWLNRAAQPRNNGWLMVGLLGSVGMLLAQSFRDFWKHTPSEWAFESWQSAEFLVFTVLFLLLLSLLFLLWRKGDKEILQSPLCYLGFFLFFYYWLGWSDPLIGAIIANLVLLAVGLYHIALGTQLDNLLILNFGLLIITAQIICRFFDTDLSFALRGLLFLLLGGGFFAANNYLLRRRQQKSEAS